MTELCPLAIASPRGKPKRGSIGVVAPNTEVKVTFCQISKLNSKSAPGLKITLLPIVGILSTYCKRNN